MTLNNKLLVLGLLASTSLPAWAETTIGGYGELQYNNLDTSSGDKRQIDFHRFVLEFGHEFNDHIRFFSEVELEHALVESGAPGAVELEQAYIEIDLDDMSSIKTGVFLLPVGIINETHEPTAYYGVERNPVEHDIIPATWWEAGAMYSAYTASGFSFDIALHSGLYDPNGNIRDARQHVAEAEAQSFAYTARLKYTGIPGMELAATAHYEEDMSQADTTPGNAGAATLLEAHGIYTIGALKLTALYAQWNIDFDGGNNPAETQDGGYLEASYKFNDRTGVFVRQNNWSTMDGVDKSQANLGVNYWVHEDVVFKADIQSQNEDAGNADGFNLGVGYQF